MVNFSKIQVQLPTADLARSGASRLPSAGKTRACTSRRRFTNHLRHRYGSRLRSARVLIGKRKRAVGRMRRGHTAVRLNLGGRTRGHVVVRIVMRLRNGHTKVDARHYHLCAVKAKPKARKKTKQRRSGSPRPRGGASTVRSVTGDEAARWADRLGYPTQIGVERRSPSRSTPFRRGLAL